MCISLTNATACRDDIQINTVKVHITVIRKIRLYPVEGPMPRASEAPFALVDIVRARSRGPQSMQDDVRSAVPRTDHQEEDALMFRRQSPGRRRDPRAITTRKKTYVDEQSRIAPQKPNRRTPRARFSSGRGFRRHCSPVALCAQRYGTGKPEGC